MIISSLHIQNFRSLLDEQLDCHDLTVLVGRNGAGKSSFLRALEIFYDPTATVSLEDFYGDESDREILISVTFTSLTDDETKLFEPYLDSDQLTVARAFSSFGGKKSGTYHGMRLQNPEFRLVREAAGKKDIASRYKEVREQPKYSLLPAAKSADDALKALREWESANPSSCVRQRDDGQFFGFTEVGQGYLGRYTRFIRIPAVRDAADDATECKGSCVTELMDLVVRSTLANRKEFITLKEETQQKYKEVMAPDKLTELRGLQTQLTETLKCYAPEARVSLEWTKLTDLDFPLPKAEVKIQEDGYNALVQHTGHGLQRAFILTMLQHLVAAKVSSRSSPADGESEMQTGERPALPNLVLAIEEPELYQHPSRQRHMAAILSRLATGTIPGVARRTQVLYTTHSPLFVGLDRFDRISLLRKEIHTEGKPKVTKITKTNLDSVAEELWVAGGK
jgi:putative ATP-dependent endonuclease of OLD family